MNEVTDNTSERRHKRISILFAIGMFVLFAVGVVFVVVTTERWRAPAHDKWNRIAVGDSESSVRESLGQPYAEYERSTAPLDYYVSGYGRRERPIIGKVLIYLEADMVFYIWIDQSSLVSETFRGIS